MTYDRYDAIGMISDMMTLLFFNWVAWRGYARSSKLGLFGLASPLPNYIKYHFFWDHTHSLSDFLFHLDRTYLFSSRLSFLGKIHGEIVILVLCPLILASRRTLGASHLVATPNHFPWIMSDFRSTARHWSQARTWLHEPSKIPRHGGFDLAYSGSRLCYGSVVYTTPEPTSTTLPNHTTTKVF